MKSCIDCKAHELLIAQEEIRFLQRMIKKYQFDNLTGLKLRTDFEDEFFRRFNNKEPFCLIIIDLDDLKKINSELGYVEGGDKAIRAVGHFLSDNIKGDCYRIGGDEFAVLSYSCTEESVKTLKGVSCAKVYADYNKHKSTKDVFIECDTILHEVKKAKKALSE